MSASLSPAQVTQYRRDGFLFPVDCLTPDEVRHYRCRLEAFEREQGDTFGKLPDLVQVRNRICCSTWMDELVRHPKVLDAVEGIIGPNILLYHLTSWLKEPNEPSHVSWHQDGTYFGYWIALAEQVTAWIALTDATPEMGCVKIIPGSHVIGQRPHKDTFSPGNLLSRGQTHRAQAGLHEVCDDAAHGRTRYRCTTRTSCIRPNRIKRTSAALNIGVSYIPPHCRLVNDERGHRRSGARARRLRALRGAGWSRDRPATLRRRLAGRSCRRSGAVLPDQTSCSAARRRSGNVGI